MTPRPPCINARQDWDWQGKFTFRLWIVNGDLRGAVLHHESGNDATRGAIGTASSVFGTAGTVIQLALLPLTIRAWLANLDHQRHTKYLLQSMESSSDEYLGWHQNNFRISKEEIACAHFFETCRFLPPLLRPQYLHIHLHDGNICEFDLNSHRAAKQFQQAVIEAGIPSRSEN